MIHFGINFYFIFSVMIFLIGLIGLAISKKNNFLLLISLEILFIAINLNFLIGSIYLDDFSGIVFVIFALAVSGAEVSIGLALFILIYKKFNTFNAYNLVNVKG
jgi:NADH-quinone oxidoreductase subunit K